jgi:peptidoglycan/xylan/chitin deacetylase (PgdA/CDA1 family)
MLALKQIAKLCIPRRVGIWKLRRAAGNSVLFTFDDGPHPDTTPGVLDRLKENDARAIFFVVGNRIPRAPHLLKRIVQEGHLIGNHTFTHPLDRVMGLREYERDLVRCQEEIVRLSGTRPLFHRPPMGQVSLASVIVPRRLRLTTLFWSCIARDWLFSSDEAAHERADELARSIQARDILLFHDERSTTLAALDRLLPALKARGINLRPDWEHVR